MAAFGGLSLRELPPLERWLRPILESDVGTIYASPFFWLLLGLVLVLERLIPAQRGQRVLSTGLLQDSLYFVLITGFRIGILSFYVKFLALAYERYLSFLTVDSLAAWPAWARLIIAVLVSDFLGWLHHVVRHKVALFWHFHTIHHSQREINVLTDVRYHPLEYLVTQTLQFLPLFMLRNAFPVALAYVFFHQWYTKLYHANLRSNFGPLRYLLVTPQSHRIHHSIEPSHRDRNFGVIFAIWDQLFGTHYPGCDEYPETGIADEGFPYADAYRPASALSSLGEQLAYPFRAIRDRRRARRRPAAPLLGRVPGEGGVRSTPLNGAP